MGNSDPAARDLAARLWSESRAAARGNTRGHIPLAKELPRLQFLPELKYVNERWVLQTPMGPTRGGALGRVLRWFKAIVTRLVLSSINGYLLDEREFLSNLVRLENEVVKRCEYLTDEIRILAQMMEAESHRLSERAELLHRLLEERIENALGPPSSGEPR